jgi:enolase
MGFGAEEVYHNLKSVIKKKYGQDACNVGDEGRQSYSKILDVFHV